MNDEISNQRLLELIGEIDAITLETHPSMGNDGYTAVVIHFPNERIEVLRDRSRTPASSIEVNRVQIKEAIQRHLLRGLR